MQRFLQERRASVRAVLRLIAITVLIFSLLTCVSCRAIDPYLDENGCIDPDEAIGSDSSYEGSENEDKPAKTEQTTGGYPWETGGKQPKDYTWEEFMALTDSQKTAFCETFANAQEFQKWMDESNVSSEQQAPADNSSQETVTDAQGETPKTEAVKPSDENTEPDSSSDNSENKPETDDSSSETNDDNFVIEDDDSSKESNKKPSSNQNAGSVTGNIWWPSNWVTPGETRFEEQWAEEEKLPWETGGKTPDTYTWEEYKALSDEQKIAFMLYFESISAYAEWRETALWNDEMMQNGSSGSQNVGEEVTEEIPWENGGKPPIQYTWAEFLALSPYLQMEFQNSFESSDAFEAWQLNAQSGGTLTPWELEGRHPSEYTWAEFIALSPEMQIRFQNSFASIDEFDQWLIANQP